MASFPVWFMRCNYLVSSKFCCRPHHVHAMMVVRILNLSLPGTAILPSLALESVAAGMRRLPRSSGMLLAVGPEPRSRPPAGGKQRKGDTKTYETRSAGLPGATEQTFGRGVPGAGPGWALVLPGGRGTSCQRCTFQPTAGGAPGDCLAQVPPGLRPLATSRPAGELLPLLLLSETFGLPRGPRAHGAGTG